MLSTKLLTLYVEFVNDLGLTKIIFYVAKRSSLVWDHTWKGSGRVSVVHGRRNDCVSIDRTICEQLFSIS